MIQMKKSRHWRLFPLICWNITTRGSDNIDADVMEAAPKLSGKMFLNLCFYFVTLKENIYN